jgi:hypothetical protein
VLSGVGVAVLASGGTFLGVRLKRKRRKISTFKKPKEIAKKKTEKDVIKEISDRFKDDLE